MLSWEEGKGGVGIKDKKVLATVGKNQTWTVETDSGSAGNLATGMLTFKTLETSPTFLDVDVGGDAVEGKSMLGSGEWILVGFIPLGEGREGLIGIDTECEKCRLDGELFCRANCPLRNSLG